MPRIDSSMNHDCIGSSESIPNLPKSLILISVVFEFVFEFSEFVFMCTLCFYKYISEIKVIIINAHELLHFPFHFEINMI